MTMAMAVAALLGLHSASTPAVALISPPTGAYSGGQSPRNNSYTAIARGATSGFRSGGSVAARPIAVATCAGHSRTVLAGLTAAVAGVASVP